jgi:hypothetical protein
VISQRRLLAKVVQIPVTASCTSLKLHKALVTPLLCMLFAAQANFCTHAHWL